MAPKPIRWLIMLLWRWRVPCFFGVHRPYLYIGRHDPGVVCWYCGKTLKTMAEILADRLERERRDKDDEAREQCGHGVQGAAGDDHASREVGQPASRGEAES